MTHRAVVPTPPSEMLLQWASAAPSNGFLSLSAKMGANDSQPFMFSCSSRWKVGPIPSCCSWARPGSTAMKEMLCQLEVRGPSFHVNVSGYPAGAITEGGCLDT